MASVGVENAHEAAAAEVRGLGLPEKKDGLHGEREADTLSEDTVVIPTEEELATLLRVPAPIPWICFTIAFVELCERFAYYGTTAVMTNFIQRPLPLGSPTGSDPSPNGQPGALDGGQRASNGLVTFNRFWAYFMPLFGGYIADSKWGRFKTIQVSIAVAMLGHIIIIISAIPKVIENRTGAMACFSVGLVFFGMGVGGFKPNISPMMAEQLVEKPMHIEVRRNGERVIVDPALTTQRMFMYFYLFINIGSIVGQITMVYAERYVGFWLSFTLPTIMFALCPLVLLVFHKKYNMRPPTGSVLGKSMRLLSFACKNKVSLNPVTSLRNIRSPSFWDDVKPSRVSNKPTWMTFDDAWVDEVARAIKACLVFAFFPLFWLAYNQIDSNLVSQAATMELHGVPNDLLNNLNPLGIIIMIPILDNIVYPLLRRLKLRYTPLRRMCAGFFIAAAGMIWATVIQYYIYKLGKCGHYMNECDERAPINVWTQAGSYVLIGLAEIMASITGLEYAYTKSPANMKSLVFGFYNFTSAISAAIGEAFVSLSEDPLLVWNYGSVAIIAFVGGVMFWYFFTRPWDRLEEHDNLLKESEYKGNNLGGVPNPKLEGDDVEPARPAPRDLERPDIKKETAI